MCKIICKHKQGSTVAVKHKMLLNVSALNEQPQVEFKVVPYVKQAHYSAEDTSVFGYAALQATMSIPSKCTRKLWLTKHSKTSLKITGSVKNNRTGRTLHEFKHPLKDEDEVVISMERLEVNVPQFLSHLPIIYEECDKFLVDVCVELFQHGNEQEFKHEVGETEGYVHVDL